MGKVGVAATAKKCASADEWVVHPMTKQHYCRESPLFHAPLRTYEGISGNTVYTWLPLD